jgi:predicted unusual protein kinase regulating ubiquinone biosynthesis (AarF/ABC1/UbiB family)
MAVPEEKCPTKFMKTPHLIIMNELANGDLKQYLYNYSTRPQNKNRDIFSALSQIFMGIAALQTHLHTIHNDLHWGNVLYHSITPGGWWWYRVGDTDVYIRNTGQLWVLWDFGMAVETKLPIRNNKTIIELYSTDFQKIIESFSAFLMLDSSGIDSDFKILVKSIYDIFKTYSYTFDFLTVLNIIVTVSSSADIIRILSRPPKKEEIINVAIGPYQISR